MLTSADILEREGWTRAAINKFLPRPDATETWRYSGHGSGLRFFYDDARVISVESSGQFRIWKNQRAARIARAALRAVEELAIVRARTEALAYAKALRLAKLAECYEDWHSALPVACEYLFDLNRYAKHHECGRMTRDRIYAAKNLLLEVLYHHGYSSECYEHHTVLDAKICFGCDGTGQDEDFGNCMRCGGTGVFAPPKRLQFVIFRFQVEGKHYCWHQPYNLVRFPIVTTREPAEFSLTAEKKPVSLPFASVGEALELIEWVIAQAINTESSGAGMAAKLDAPSHEAVEDVAACRPYPFAEARPRLPKVGRHG